MNTLKSSIPSMPSMPSIENQQLQETQQFHQPRASVRSTLKMRSLIFMDYKDYNANVALVQCHEGSKTRTNE